MGEVDTEQGAGPDRGGLGGKASPQEQGGPGGDRPPGASTVPATGHAGVDDAVAGLSRLPGLPVADHVAILEEVHGRLRDILDELAEPAGGDPPRTPRPSGPAGGDPPRTPRPSGEHLPEDPVRQKGRP
jgi:hypothetical protein